MHLPLISAKNWSFIGKALAMLMLSAWFLIATFGVVMHFSEHEGHTGGSHAVTTNFCIFSSMMPDQKGACPIDVTAHLTAWQHIFQIMPVFLLLSLVILFVQFSLHSFEIRQRAFYKVLQRLLHTRNHMAKLYDYLVLLFSQGILRTKTY